MIHSHETVGHWTSAVVRKWRTENPSAAHRLRRGMRSFSIFCDGLSPLLSPASVISSAIEHGDARPLRAEEWEEWLRSRAEELPPLRAFLKAPAALLTGLWSAVTAQSCCLSFLMPDTPLGRAILAVVGILVPTAQHSSARCAVECIPEVLVAPPRLGAGFLCAPQVVLSRRPAPRVIGWPEGCTDLNLATAAAAIQRALSEPE